MRPSPVLLPRAMAAYACGRTGICCRWPWRVYVEFSEIDRLRAGLRAADAGRSLLPLADDCVLPAGRSAETGQPVFALRRPEGTCLFNQGDRTCGVHATLGVSSLPVVCRDYPRESFATPAGIEVRFRLSCPTAAALAVAASREPYAIVPMPADGDWPHGHRSPPDDALPVRWTESLPLAWDDFAAFRSAAVELLAGPHDADALDGGLAGLAGSVEEAGERGPGWVQARLRPGDPDVLRTHLARCQDVLAAGWISRLGSELAPSLPDAIVSDGALPAFFDALAHPAEVLDRHAATVRNSHAGARNYLVADRVYFMAIQYGPTVVAGIRRALVALALFDRLACTLGEVGEDSQDPRCAVQALALTEYLLPRASTLQAPSPAFSGRAPRPRRG